ncbi:MAG: transporter substrate-binding domain-containing protein [Lachnospiraceae bacterium]|nr:transporter substrate-binding domain-containing protein [Lachnospiraceae bacterium]
MTTKNKLLTVLAVFIVLLLLAGAGAFKADTAKGGVKDISNVKTLGGIESAMPENSALVFFGSTMGKTLSGYKAYKNMDALLFALKSGEVDAIWACDVTADFLLTKDTGLKKLNISGMSDIQKTKDARFEFGMALKDMEGSKKLRDDIDTVISAMKSDGSLNEIIQKYIYSAWDFETDEGKEKRFYASDMRSASGKNTIYVGITGAVPPLNMLDEDGKPYGFCVALMDEIGMRLGRGIEFVILDNETAFTSLMKGKVDLIFSYGTGMITTENKKNYIMTEGYYPMERYEFLIYGKNN